MNIITLTNDNLAGEHICCSISEKKKDPGVDAKKDWLRCRFKDGLKFKKADIRGKVFIEYISGENAWMPVEAEGYNHINCFWVSGSHKSHGYGKQLLEACELDSKETNGITVVVGNKKKSFLSDKSFFLKYGFEVCDTASPYFELLVKRYRLEAAMPSFKSSARAGIIADDIRGIDIFYTPQCPFTVPYIEILKPVILASEIPVRTHLIKSKEEAQSHFCPVTTYSVFVNGKYETNEILTAAKLDKMIKSINQ